MLKKIVIILLSIVGVLSLGLNYFAIKNVIPKYTNEENRAKKTAEAFRFFGYGPSRLESIKENEPSISNDDRQFLYVIDTAYYRILRMQEEFVSTSGGIDPETGMFINAYGINYIEQYFYGKNYYRSNAINFYNSTVKDYSDYMNKRGFKSSFVESTELYNKYVKQPLFKEMSVAETMAYMELLKSHLLLDRYIYLAGKCGSS